MKWTDLLAFRRALRELVTDWDDYVENNLECLRNGCYYMAKVCDAIDLPAISLCHSVLTNLRFGLPHITIAEELSPMPRTSLDFPHRQVLGFEALPLQLRFDWIEETPAQRDESMTEAMAAMAELGIFIRAAERCGGMEEFQDALQALLSTMSQFAGAYLDFWTA